VRVTGSAGYTALVVDDDADTRDLLRVLLEGRGHRVIVASDSRHAVEMATTELPEIALIDIGPPSVDGYRLARSLRAIRRAMLLVALTGYSADRERAVDTGFDVHLNKPLEPERLFQIVDAFGPHPLWERPHSAL
jgi:CheY-like chemotaxis protein